MFLSLKIMRFLIYSRKNVEGITVVDNHLAMTGQSGKGYQWMLKLVGVGLMMEEIIRVILKYLPIKC